LLNTFSFVTLGLSSEANNKVMNFFPSALAYKYSVC